MSGSAALLGGHPGAAGGEQHAEGDRGDDFRCAAACAEQFGAFGVVAVGARWGFERQLDVADDAA